MTRITAVVFDEGRCMKCAHCNFTEIRTEAGAARGCDEGFPAAGHPCLRWKERVETRIGCADRNRHAGPRPRTNPLKGGI